MTQVQPIPASVPRGKRVRVFIDFWNFVLNVRPPPSDFKIDWAKVPRWLAEKGAAEVGLTDLSYEGAHVFASYNPATDANLKQWLTRWLSKQPGVQVNLKERRRRNPPKCPQCHLEVAVCASCGSSMGGTEEKGVDAGIVTAMIRLAWEDTYDIAVLATSDADLIPAVEFLDLRGRKVIQAGFPPSGAELASACWGAFNVAASLEEIRRA